MIYDAAPAVRPCHSVFRRVCKPAHTYEHRPRCQCGSISGSFICRKACSRIMHALLDYPLFSCQTHSSQLQKAGQSGTQVRRPHLPEVMWPIICFLRFCFSLSSEVVTVRNGLFFFCTVSAHRHILDVSLQDSKRLLLRGSV